MVLYHACQWTDAGFKIGAAGVDLFFVISGFVMGLALPDPAARPGEFLRRRLWRVAPAYWLVTFAVLFAALTWPRLLPRVYPTPGQTLLSLLFIPHLDPAGLPFPLLPVGWSLSYEMIFYGLVAISLTQPAKRRFGVLAAGLIGVMLSGAIVHPAFFLFANPMMLQFLAGVLIARAYGQGRLPRRDAGWSLIASGAVIYVALAGLDLYGSLLRPLLWGAPAALVVAGAVSLEAQGVRIRLPVLGLLGEASYSIYLCHWPVVAILAKLAGPPSPWLFAPLAAAAVAVGLAFWWLIERPLMRWGRGPVIPAPSAGVVAVEAAA